MGEGTKCLEPECQKNGAGGLGDCAEAKVRLEAPAFAGWIEGGFFRVPGVGDKLVDYLHGDDEVLQVEELARDPG